MKPSLDWDYEYEIARYVYRLYYDPEENVIVDECGFMIFDIFRIISPNVLLVFRARKGYMFTYDLSGCPVELFYMNDKED